jgi:hypothetical protein
MLSQKLGGAHAIISQLWTDETAHRSYRPRPAGFSESYGQCVPTTHLLFNILSRNFPEHGFSIASGIVLAFACDNTVPRVAVDRHAWLYWQPRGEPLLKDIVVVDPTSDQIPYVDLSPCEVQTNEELLGRGAVYQALRIFNTVEAFEQQLVIREPTVRDRVQRLYDHFDSFLEADSIGS